MEQARKERDQEPEESKDRVDPGFRFSRHRTFRKPMRTSTVAKQSMAGKTDKVADRV